MTAAFPSGVVCVRVDGLDGIKSLAVENDASGFTYKIKSSAAGAATGVSTTSFTTLFYLLFILTTKFLFVYLFIN